MCFSASTSFAAAAGTGLVGVLTARRMSARREVPLASIPLIFAVQQSIEGVLWLTLGSQAHASWIAPLANGFIFLALVVWPVWAPLSAGLVERERMRRLVMAGLFVLAIPLAYVGARDIWAHPYGVCVVQYSLSYSNGFNYSPLELAVYVLCTCCPFLLSSHAALRTFGAILVAGLIVSASLYWLAFISVWCFFAAAASLMIYLHFTRAYKKGAKPLLG